MEGSDNMAFPTDLIEELTGIACRFKNQLNALSLHVILRFRQHMHHSAFPCANNQIFRSSGKNSVDVLDADLMSAFSPPMRMNPIRINDDITIIAGRIDHYFAKRIILNHTVSYPSWQIRSEIEEAQPESWTYHYSLLLSILLKTARIVNCSEKINFPHISAVSDKIPCAQFLFDFLKTSSICALRRVRYI